MASSAVPTPAPMAHGRGPRPVQRHAGSGASCQAVPGAFCPPSPTQWSPAFCNLRLTHADPAPHLASIWGWHSKGGGHIWLGKSEDPQGASDPRPREGSASL